jgi:hypothetical protein
MAEQFTQSKLRYFFNPKGSPARSDLPSDSDQLGSEQPESVQRLRNKPGPRKQRLGRGVRYPNAGLYWAAFFET